MTEAVLEAGSWIYKMFVTLVLAVVVVAIVGLVVRSENNTIDLQRELFFNRILYDPQGIWFVDQSGIMHPAVIEKTSFTQTHVDLVFQYAENYGGAKLELIDGETSSIYINTTTYNRLATNVNADIKDGGTMVERTYPVVIHEGTARRNGWLRITVVMPARA